MVHATSIRSRLLKVEDEFLAALEDGDSVMDRFSNSWTSLQRDIQLAQLAGKLTQENAELAYAVSARVGIIAEAFEDLDRAAHQLSNELNQELDRLLGEPLSNDNLEIKNSNKTTGVPCAAPYIQSAYTWLLDNLHNPYPPKEVKDFFVKKSGSSVKLVDAWFVDVRKRMGWSKIKQTHFQNKRKPLIDAATCFFIGNGNLSPVLMGEFTSMEMSARELYSGKWLGSDISNESFSESSRNQVEQFRHISSYPSPRQSPERTSLPLFGCPTTEVPPSIESSSLNTANSRKRPRSEDIATSDSFTNDTSPRSPKRLRNSTAAIISEIGIPSPIPSPPNPPRTFELSSTSQVTALSSSVSPQRQLHSFSPTIPYHIGHFPEDRPPNGMQPVSLPITVTNALAPDSSRPALIDCSSSAEAEAGSIDMVQQCPFLPDVPDIQPIAVSDGGKFPQFSFKLPEPVACDQPPFQTMDLSLFGSGIFQENQESWLLPSAMCDRDSLSVNPTSSAMSSKTAQSNGGADSTSLSGFLDLLSVDQLTELLPPTFDLSTMSNPTSQIDESSFSTEEDANFGTLLHFDLVASPRLSQSQDDSTLLSDLLESRSPRPSGTEKAKQVAQLEALKKEKDQLQERIQMLEKQLSSAISA